MKSKNLFLVLSTLLLLGMSAEVSWAKSCKRGKPCGNTCIPLNRVCKAGSSQSNSGLQTKPYSSNSESLSEAVLIAQETNTQINLRATPTVTAKALGYGLVGDRVRVMQKTNGNDGYIWYKVRFYESQAVGWIRGDFVRIL